MSETTLRANQESSFIASVIRSTLSPGPHITDICLTEAFQKIKNRSENTYNTRKQQPHNNYHIGILSIQVIPTLVCIEIFLKDLHIYC